MRNYDFIYGSKVIIQCQAQINIRNCDTDDGESAKYLILIKKDISFFTYQCTPRHAIKCIVRESPDEHLDKDVLDKVGTNIDDMLVEQKRALSWTKTKGDVCHVPYGGHGKQQVILKAPTFCARDMGITFDPDKYSYSISD